MLRLNDLNARTRKLMRAEIEHDIQQSNLYFGKRLTPQGMADFPDLLKQAATDKDDGWLAEQIRQPGRQKEWETATRKGREYSKRVPVNAHESLAEGEFNRFFARALCLCAIEDGLTELIVYRAKEVAAPRPESELRIGAAIDPKQLLDDLRTHAGRDTAFGVPGGVNSGLSVCLLATYKTISGK